MSTPDDRPWPRPLPVPFENVLRWWVHSHTIPGKVYLVDLGAFGTNGECQCKNFACELAPLLARGITPRQAFEGELVTLKENKRPEDTLRCIHILDARSQFADDFARALVRQQNENANDPTHDHPHDA